MVNPITDPEILDGYNTDALGYRGAPEGLFRPRDEAEVREILQWATANRHPLTPVGLRSATTGSCVGPRGYLLSLERMDALADVQPDALTTVCQPGANLGELKRELERQGLFFPVDPTSENDCTVGGAVATNASGARTLKYGAIRRWIRRLRVVLATGETLDLKAAAVDKNATGFFGFQDPVQFFIGSEGTLGVITEIELQCLPLPPDYLALYAFFPDEASALAAATAIRFRGVGVRCLEYFDNACLDLLRDTQSFVVPANAGGVLFIEQEAPEGGLHLLLEEWADRLEALGALVDATMVGDTAARRQEMRDWRHAIPATLNEQGVLAKASGGGKLSTDWAVDWRRIGAVLPQARALCRREGAEAIYCFGHIGNGHPHVNLLAADAEDRERAHRAAHAMCRLVQAEGGTISAEHGVGKVKKEYLPYSLPPQAIEWMKAFKRQLDPALILAPGNIFDFD